MYLSILLGLELEDQEHGFLAIILYVLIPKYDQTLHFCITMMFGSITFPNIKYYCELIIIIILYLSLVIINNVL